MFFNKFDFMETQVLKTKNTEDAAEPRTALGYGYSCNETDSWNVSMHFTRRLRLLT